MSYRTKLWQKSVAVASLPFKIDRYISLCPIGWNLSLGFSLRYTVDGPGEPPSINSDLSRRYEEIYRPLNETQKEIRLLKILPKSNANILELELVTVELEQAPDYEALSYVWGRYRGGQWATVNGYAVDVHASLYEALLALRRPDCVRLIWADALCINQQDRREKSKQVSIMSSIYETAERVTVYLGPSTELTAEGMELLRQFTETNVKQEQAPWTHIMLSEIEDSLKDILMRSWFERVWTLQEATLARKMTIQCGKHQTSWVADLRTMRSIVFRIKSTVISPLFSAQDRRVGESALDWDPFVKMLETQMRQAARREGIALQRTLLDLAYDFRHRKCADPRDRYFGIFGIIENDQGGKLALQADYTTTLEELHDRFTAEMQRLGDSIHQPAGASVERTVAPDRTGVDMSPRAGDSMNVFCSGPLCRHNKGAIAGTRFTCTVCHEFHLCEECEVMLSKTHDATHPFLKFRRSAPPALQD